MEQMKKIVPFVACGITSGQNVCELMFGVNVTDLDLGVQINLVKQPIQSNSVGPSYMSHCGAPALYKHTTWHWNQNVSRVMERDQHWLDQDRCAWLESVFTCFSECLPTRFPVTLLHVWFCPFGLVRNKTLQSLDPIDRERDSHPCVNLHREKLLQLPLNCVKLRSVSCTSN